MARKTIDEPWAGDDNPFVLPEPLHGPVEGEQQSKIPVIRLDPPGSLFSEWVETGWTLDQCNEHWGLLCSLLQSGKLFAGKRRRRSIRLGSQFSNDES